MFNVFLDLFWVFPLSLNLPDFKPFLQPSKFIWLSPKKCSVGLQVWPDQYRIFEANNEINIWEFKK